MSAKWVKIYVCDCSPDRAPTNEDRANRIDMVLETYTASKGKIIGIYDDENNLIDILADLRHWARREGLQFSIAVDMSLGHFQAECDEES